MAKVIQRKFIESTNNFPDWVDEIIDWKIADNKASHRLDRRKNYAIIDNQLCESCIFTSPCSGCNDDSEYSYNEIGTGCDECGYTGKRRRSYWVPYIKEKDY